MRGAAAIAARVARLEARAPVGCAVCRGWDGTALGDDAGRRSRPDRCPACGRGVPVRLLLVVVGVDPEAV